MADSILILQNIPTPYRAAFFDRLAVECQARGIAFRVIYCALKEYNRHWEIDPNRFEHQYEILGGFHPKFAGATFHINASIVRRIRTLAPSVLICGGAWNLPTNWLALWSLPRSSRAVFWSEGHADAVRVTSGPVAVFRKFILRRFHHFAVPNRKSASWIEAQLGRECKTVFLPNTVNEEFYNSGSASEQMIARNKLGISTNEKVLVQVSQLEVRKGVIPLLEAYARLPESGRRGSTLVILGEGSLRLKVNRHIDRLSGAGKVLAPGHQSGEQVRDWLRAADWFVLNTLSDPNPLSPIEASLTGTPLLLSSLAGNVDELLIDGETGIRIADPTNPYAQLQRAMSLSKTETTRMGRAARANVENKFSRTQAAVNLLDQLGRN